MTDAVTKNNLNTHARFCDKLRAILLIRELNSLSVDIIYVHSVTRTKETAIGNVSEALALRDIAVWYVETLFISYFMHCHLCCTHVY